MEVTETGNTINKYVSNKKSVPWHTCVPLYGTHSVSINNLDICGVFL